MLFDTHTHLQFKVFAENIDQVIKDAHKAGVKNLIACGTNLESSLKAVELSKEFRGVYAAVGIHPHHVFEQFDSSVNLREQLGGIELLLTQEKVLAVGEVGVDKYEYQKTKYKSYQINESFIDLQTDLFERQIELAKRYQKSLIVHNRQAVPETLKVLKKNWDESLKNRTVFHFCEADERLLEFAKAHGVFIGVDGDVTYDKGKQNFIQKVPLELLVLETDSPFVTPEPLKSQGQSINTPENLRLLVGAISFLINEEQDKVERVTFENSKKLFNLTLNLS